MIMVCTFRNDLRQQLVPFLRERGYEVCTPSHRQDVLPMATQVQPLVLLLDMYVTQPSGIEVLRDLRAHGFRGKVVLLGGSSLSTVIAQAHHFGVHQVVGGTCSVTESTTQQIGQIESAIRTALHAAVEEGAYRLYERRGKAHGRDLDDWLESERQIFKRDPSEEGNSQSPQTFIKEKQPKKSRLRVSILEDVKEKKR